MNVFLSPQYDVERLDVAAAWLDAYARLSGLPWLEEKESEFAAGLDKLLEGTSYARIGRQVGLRSEAGTSPVVEEPLRRLLSARPQYRDLEAKLAEAQSELDRGRPADAITDVGTAFQILLGLAGCEGKTIGVQVSSARKPGTPSPASTRNSARRWRTSRSGSPR